MGCRNGGCEYEGLKRKLILTENKSPDEIRYAQLWAEMNLPKERQNRGREK